MRGRLPTYLLLCFFGLMSTYAEARGSGGVSKTKHPVTNVLVQKTRSSTKPSQGQIRQYTNAKLGFTLPVPVNAKVIERKGTNQTSIRSRKGYVINIQAGPKRPELALAQMAKLLEAKYLGEGKPWESRGRDGPRKIAGMSAHEVLYRGTGSTTRLVVARGDVNDYVFIFIASAYAFKRLDTEFEWLLENFRPNPNDVTISKTHRVLEKNGSSEPRGAKRFAEPHYGYTIEYPAAWEMSKPANMTTMFSGRDGTPEYAAIVTIQNIKPPGAKNSNEAGAKVLNQMKVSLGKAVKQLIVLEDKKWMYSKLGKMQVGRQLLINYKHQGVVFQKRMIVMPRLRDTVVHIWSYTAPKLQYVSLKPRADIMLRSWTILMDNNK